MRYRPNLNQYRNEREETTYGKVATSMVSFSVLAGFGIGMYKKRTSILEKLGGTRVGNVIINYVNTTNQNIENVTGLSVGGHFSNMRSHILKAIGSQVAQSPGLPVHTQKWMPRAKTEVARKSREMAAQAINFTEQLKIKELQYKIDTILNTMRSNEFQARYGLRPGDVSEILNLTNDIASHRAEGGRLTDTMRGASAELRRKRATLSTIEDAVQQLELYKFTGAVGPKKILPVGEFKAELRAASRIDPGAGRTFDRFVGKDIKFRAVVGGTHERSLRKERATFKMLERQQNLRLKSANFLGNTPGLELTAHSTMNYEGRINKLRKALQRQKDNNLIRDYKVSVVGQRDGSLFLETVIMPVSRKGTSPIFDYTPLGMVSKRNELISSFSRLTPFDDVYSIEHHIVKGVSMDGKMAVSADSSELLTKKIGAIQRLDTIHLGGLIENLHTITKEHIEESVSARTSRAGEKMYSTIWSEREQYKGYGSFLKIPNKSFAVQKSAILDALKMKYAVASNKKIAYLDIETETARGTKGALTMLGISSTYAEPVLLVNASHKMSKESMGFTLLGGKRLTGKDAKSARKIVAGWAYSPKNAYGGAELTEQIGAALKDADVVVVHYGKGDVGTIRSIAKDTGLESILATKKIVDSHTIFAAIPRTHGLEDAVDHINYSWDKATGPTMKKWLDIQVRDGKMTLEQRQKLLPILNLMHHMPVSDTAATEAIAPKLAQEVLNYYSVGSVESPADLYQLIKRTEKLQNDGDLHELFEINLPGLAAFADLRTSNAKKAGKIPLHVRRRGASPAQITEGAPFIMRTKLRDVAPAIRLPNGRLTTPAALTNDAVSITYGTSDATVAAMATAEGIKYGKKPKTKYINAFEARVKSLVATGAEYKAGNEYRAPTLLVLNNADLQMSSGQISRNIADNLYVPISTAYTIEPGQKELLGKVQQLNMYKEIIAKNESPEAVNLARTEERKIQNFLRTKTKMLPSELRKVADAGLSDILVTQHGGKTRLEFLSMVLARRAGGFHDISADTGQKSTKTLFTKEMEALVAMVEQRTGVKAEAALPFEMGRGNLAEILDSITEGAREAAANKNRPDLVKKLERIKLVKAGSGAPSGLQMQEAIQATKAVYKELGVVHTTRVGKDMRKMLKRHFLGMEELIPTSIKDAVDKGLKREEAAEIFKAMNMFIDDTPGSGALYHVGTFSGKSSVAFLTSSLYMIRGLLQSTVQPVTMFTGLAAAELATSDRVRAILEEYTLTESRSAAELAKLAALNGVGGTHLRATKGLLQPLDKTTEFRDIFAKIRTLENSAKAAGRQKAGAYKVRNSGAIMSLIEKLQESVGTNQYAQLNIGGEYFNVSAAHIANIDPTGQVHTEQSLGRKIAEAFENEHSKIGTAAADSREALRVALAEVVNSKAGRAAETAMLPGFYGSVLFNNKQAFGTMSIGFGDARTLLLQAGVSEKALKETKPAQMEKLLAERFVARGTKQPNISQMMAPLLKVDTSREYGLGINAITARLLNLDFDADHMIIPLISLNGLPEQMRKRIVNDNNAVRSKMLGQYNLIVNNFKQLGPGANLSDFMDEQASTLARRFGADGVNILAAASPEMFPGDFTGGIFSMTTTKGEIISKEVKLGRWGRRIAGAHKSSFLDIAKQYGVDTKDTKALFEYMLQQGIIGEQYNIALTHRVLASSMADRGFISRGDQQFVATLFAGTEFAGGIKGLKGNAGATSGGMLMGAIGTERFAPDKLYTFLHENFLGTTEGHKSIIAGITKYHESMLSLGLGGHSNRIGQLAADTLVEELGVRAAAAGEEAAARSAAETGVIKRLLAKQRSIPKYAIFGAAVLGAAYFFKPNQMKVLGNQPGKGGEFWDYKTGGSELPFSTPLDIPQYTWDEKARVTGTGVLSKMAQLGSNLIPGDFTAQTHYNYTRNKEAYDHQPAATIYSDRRQRYNKFTSGSVWRQIHSVQ